MADTPQTQADLPVIDKLIDADGTTYQLGGGGGNAPSIYYNGVKYTKVSVNSLDGVTTFSFDNLTGGEGDVDVDYFLQFDNFPTEEKDDFYEKKGKIPTQSKVVYIDDSKYTGSVSLVSENALKSKYQSLKRKCSATKNVCDEYTADLSMYESAEKYIKQLEGGYRPTIPSDGYGWTLESAKAHVARGVPSTQPLNNALEELRALKTEAENVQSNYLTKINMYNKAVDSYTNDAENNTNNFKTLVDNAKKAKDDFVLAYEKNRYNIYADYIFLTEDSGSKLYKKVEINVSSYETAKSYTPPTSNLIYFFDYPACKTMKKDSAAGLNAASCNSISIEVNSVLNYKYVYSPIPYTG